MVQAVYQGAQFQEVIYEMNVITYYMYLDSVVSYQIATSSADTDIVITTKKMFTSKHNHPNQ